ncbi:hypothetical protein EDB92DRAFT_2112603 [Lactarius akahatsu]|uniref:PH domain-containing protein n=1 Tax=Lactarius akahatsu TaxID=416441 RepID=A0AAD4QD68_9AGAM|nr:hypothetical protein EDB92DRAFT_2112603 [Lactarius akahatsu]
MAPLRDRPPSNTTEPERPPQSSHTPSHCEKRHTWTPACITDQPTKLQYFCEVNSQQSCFSISLSFSSLFRPRAISSFIRCQRASTAPQNERPLGFKRRQSKGFQNLIEKEPVSKSPFRRPTSPDEDPFPPPPPPPKVIHTSHLPTPSSSASPGRSSLVSKRLHGPRLIGHDVPKRQRRKTVTFDETCDVVTFERDDSLDSDVFSDDDDDDDDDYGEPEEYGEPAEIVEANDSITGLVDSMIQDARDASNPQTPPMDRSLPPHMDNQDGVPYEILETLTSAAKQSPSVPSTPPQDRMPDDVEDDVRMLPPSPSPATIKKHPPSDRSESLLPKLDFDIHRQDVNDESGSEHAHSFNLPRPEDVQIVELSFMSSEGHSGSLSERVGAFQHDPLAVELDAELGIVVQSTPNSQIQTSTPPLRLKSPGGSLGKVSESPSSRVLPRPPRSRSESPLPPRMESPFWSRSGSPSLAHRGSPSLPPGSPAFTASSHIAPPFSFGFESVLSMGSLGSRGSIESLSRRNPRIDREDIHKRLLRKRNTDSPAQEEPGEISIADRSTGGDATGISAELDDVSLAPPQSLVPPPLHRDGTYDGVMSIDPNPQPADPPRPSLVVRAQSELEAGASTTGFQTRIRHVSPGLDLGISAPGTTRVEIDEHVITALPPRPQYEGQSRLFKIATVTKGIKARMYDPPDGYDNDITMEEEEEEKPDDHESQHLTPDESMTPELLSGGGFMSPSLSRNASESSNPLQPVQKDAIRTREQIILEKRREMRRREQDEDLGYVTPPRNPPSSTSGRPSARRSMSTGDAEDLQAAVRSAALNPSGSSVLPEVVATEEKDPLAESIARELRKLRGSTKGRYHVRQHSETIYASSDADRVSHINGAGDVDGGRAWRTVRRPSDMNEYAKQIREYRSQERAGKSHGKVFVRVIHAKGLDLPFPQQNTLVTCTLNNGIHFVTTPECKLAKDCQIEQEFELIEHSKLEFTLTLKVRRDPHIVSQFRANTPAPPPPPPPAPPASKGGMRSFFSSSPKKPARVIRPVSVAPVVLEENLARYLKPDGTLARAFVSFKDIASRCDTRLFETSYPLIGQRLESGSKVNSIEIGELVLQFFRLPPLPGIPSSQLPQSLDECHRGLRHVHWHKMTYFEGTLTQNGGDCSTWRRRQFRVIGANLVAFNDVTKRATVTIDLRRALAVEDIPDPRNRVLSTSSAQTSLGHFDEFEGLYGVERSFRLRFQRNLEIVFFTDTDEEKERWLEVLRALIGRIPPNHLWAELLWQRQQDLTKHLPSAP